MASESYFMNKQTRSYNLSIKASEGDNADYGYFEGYGSVFGVVDAYRDCVDKGAFADSLSKKMPKLLLQHRGDMVAGKFTEAREDEHGLYLKGRLNLKVQHAREAYELLKDGSFEGMSIGFSVNEEELDKTTGVNHLKKIDLWEVSLVTFQACEPATVTQVKAAPVTIRSFEDFLRDEGKYSRSDAEFIALNGFRAYEARRDGGDLSAVVTGLESLKKQLMKSLPNDTRHSSG